LRCGAQGNVTPDPYRAQQKGKAMHRNRFDRLAAAFGAAASRRTLLQEAVALGAAAVGGALVDDVAAAKTLCRKNGARCKKKGKKCRAKYCLATPFTIEARWNSGNDHDTVFFVPNKAGSNVPAPFIDYGCGPITTDCEDDVYPFACVTGNETTTVRRLLGGKYEYWIELLYSTPLGDVEVILRNANGRLVRSWSSPPNPNPGGELGWHVFDIDGASRSITSVDALINSDLPNGAHTPNTNVCPG
jgi:hypothetical protein